MDPSHDPLAFAVATARAAGALLLEHFGRELQVTTKSSAIDLVTSADRAAEALIVTRLREAFPEHGVLAEESGWTRAGAWRWIVDPLDGTSNFAHQIPHFSVSIALAGPAQVELGVVHDPVRGETFVGARGRGAHRLRPEEDAPGDASARLRVSSCDALGRAMLATGFSYARRTSARDNLVEFARLVPKIRGIRRMGSAALDLAYVAAGRLDGFWEYHLQPWDTAAGGLLVREAGGEIVALPSARPWSTQDGDLACAGPALLPALMAALRGPA